MMLPIGMLLKPGFRVVIDKAEPIDGKYDMCFQNACTAEVEIGASTLSNLKKGQNLAVVMRVPGGDPSGRELTFNIPLKDFGTTFDGKPTDPKLLEQQRQALQQQLQKKAEEQRKLLEQQQQQRRRPAAAGGSGCARRSRRAEAVTRVAAPSPAGRRDAPSKSRSGRRVGARVPLRPSALAARASARHRAGAEPVASVGRPLEASR